MKQTDSWPDRAFLQKRIFKGNAHELSIQGEAKSAQVHVKEYSEYTLLLEYLTVSVANRVVGVAKLTKSVVSKTKFIV